MKNFIKLLLLAAVALPSWVGVAAQSVVPTPSGTPEAWRLVSAWYTNVGTIVNPTFDPIESFGRNTINVVIDGNQMYLQGLCKALPDAWVVGTISGSTVTFAKNQFFGNEVNGAHHYLVGEGVMDGQGNITEGTPVDVVMNYDATNKILTMSNSSLYVLDCDRADGYVVESHQVGVDNTLSSWGYHEGLEIYQPAVKQMKTLSRDDIEAMNITYTYPITTNAESASVLDPVTVTDDATAAQAIALIRAIYTDRRFPGPYTRGYTSDGQPEGTVSYAAVGSMTATASRTQTGNGSNRRYHLLLSNLGYSNSYGWNIEPNNYITKTYPESGNGSYNIYVNGGYSTCNDFQYAYFDPTDYKPMLEEDGDNEGYTMLLVEVKDDFQFNSSYYTNGAYVDDPNKSAYENLVEYVKNTIKRVTLLTEAKRTGNNLTSGTLYKIDANQINRFFLISKGQVRLYRNSYNSTIRNLDYCDEPHYGLNSYSSNYDEYYQERFIDKSSERLFYHMFEQFSPSLGTDAGQTKADIYKALVNADPMGEQKTGFPVFHDCISVPYAKLTNDNTTGAGGHEFQMSEANSSLSYDMRDLLFFVPDRRMTQHDGWSYTSVFDNTTTSVDNRDARVSSNYYQAFINYCSEYAPRMDMYVIHLNEIEGEQVQDDEGVDLHLYQLNLNWASNMSNFLPGEEQVYYLWRKVTDANGESKFERVMKWTRDAQGNWVETDVPVVIQGIYGKFTLDYADHIAMDQTGKLVTYYVQGKDVDGFLEFQSSNQQSYAVPGYDKSVRLSLKIDSDRYSKFVVNEEKNNYYNEVVVSNNYGTDVTANYLEPNTVIYFQRFDNSLNDQNDNERTPTIVATATVTSKDVANGTITVSMEYLNQVTFDGAKTGAINQPPSFTFTFEKGNQEGHLDFGTNASGESTFRFYDNFTAGVSNNEHPHLYLYRAFFESAEYFPLEDGTDETSNKVYSNLKPVVIHKTDPSVGGAFTLDEVLADSDMSQELPESPTYTITLEQASKGEFYGYQFGHWEDKENATAPSVIAANADGFYGYAQNQDNSYSLHFGNNPVFSEDQSGTSATLKDLELQATGGAYIYVPQALDLNGNTYGAPRKATAVGKLEVSAATPDTDHPLMSDYKWFNDGKWYSYYNIFLNFSTLEVPEGYELYKVRAWRKVSDDILGEEISTRAGRATNDWYMYEDINFRDDLGLYDANGNHVEAYMSKTELAKDTYFLGSRPATVGKPLNPEGYSEPGGGTLFGVADTQNPVAGEIVEDLVKNELRATFGAQRLKTDDPNDPGTLEELNAEFKVRAYFTKSTNPLITDPISAVNYDPIYVVGLDENGGWDLTKSLAVLRTTDGSTYIGTVDIPDAGDGNGLVTFSKKLASSSADWEDFNQYRFGLNNTVSYWNDGSDNVWVAESNLGGTEYDLRYYGGSSRNFRIKAGTYQLSITGHKPKSNNNSYDAGSLKFTAATANAPRRAGETRMTGDDYDYYVAESEVIKFTQKGGTGVITGIGAVKMEVNREVVGVSYVNTIGQVSSTPWQGVNMVVTRYSDGSTTTRKVIK